MAVAIFCIVGGWIYGDAVEFRLSCLLQKVDLSSHIVEGWVCLVLARLIILCWLPGIKKHSEDRQGSKNNL